jgi:hypothetical protein
MTAIRDLTQAVSDSWLVSGVAAIPMTVLPRVNWSTAASFGSALGKKPGVRAIVAARARKPSGTSTEYRYRRDTNVECEALALWQTIATTPTRGIASFRRSVPKLCLR